MYMYEPEKGEPQSLARGKHERTQIPRAGGHRQLELTQMRRHARVGIDLLPPRLSMPLGCD